MQYLNYKTRLYSILIFVMFSSLLFYHCSGSSYNDQKTEGMYKVYLPSFNFFIDTEILTFEDNNKRLFYVITDIFPDTFTNNNRFKKMSAGKRYKIAIEKIDTVVVLKSYQNLKNYSQDGVLIWSDDTIRVPIYTSRNLYGRYLKK